jgi:hypothetical protein
MTIYDILTQSYPLTNVRDFQNKKISVNVFFRNVRVSSGSRMKKRCIVVLCLSQNSHCRFRASPKQISPIAPQFVEQIQWVYMKAKTRKQGVPSKHMCFSVGDFGKH